MNRSWPSWSIIGEGGRSSMTAGSSDSWSSGFKTETLNTGLTRIVEGSSSLTVVGDNSCKTLKGPIQRWRNFAHAWPSAPRAPSDLDEQAPVDFLRTSSHASDDQHRTPDEPLLLVGSPWRCSVNVVFLLTNFLQLGSLEIRLLQGEDLLQTADFDHRSERKENSV